MTIAATESNIAPRRYVDGGQHEYDGKRRQAETRPPSPTSAAGILVIA